MMNRHCHPNRGMHHQHCCPPHMSPTPFPTQVSPAQMNPGPMNPTQVSPTQFAPAQISPTQQFVRTNVSNTVVPHIHPSHTTTINRHNIHNEHYFPHTESVRNECCETNTICPMPNQPMPRPRRGLFGF